jgi:hypothetical protein
MTAPLLVADSIDAFHPWPADDPHWTETCWYGAWIPEHSLSIYVYHWFRPNLGIYGGGCLVWDDRHWLPWDLPVYDYAVNRPIGATLDLRQLKLDCGTTIDSLREGERYLIRYRQRQVKLELEFDAISPVELTDSAGTSEFFAGHIDQAGHYRGSLELEGRRYAIDCHGIRDRSWGPRVITDDIRLGYCHGQSQQLAFLAYTRPGGDAAPSRDHSAEEPVFKGYLQRDGERVALAHGTRRVHVANGRLDHIDIELADQHGRALSGRGVPLNRFAYMPFPNLLTWLYLMRWEFAEGTIYGEEQDAWSLPLCRAHRRGGGWGA